MNRANASRWAALLAFFHRKLAGQKARKAENPHASLTARQETVIEVGELWGIPTGALRRELNTAVFLAERMPSVFALVKSGALDNYRARLIADALRREVDDETSLDATEKRISTFLLKHRRVIEEDDDGSGLICCTTRQLQNKLSYEIRRLRSPEAEARFAQRYAARRATAQTGGDGMGWLSIEHAVDRVQVAHHRLTLAAKGLRAGGDSRTLDQLRCDLALDLLIGVDSNGEQTNVPVPSFARPIINVTVPIQTLMGIGDHPGELSGGTVIPASLARVIAARPGAAWYRMLTDEHGQMSELSTKSYQPTAPIWRHVVADQTSCFRPGCDRPATDCELDHRRRWPEGPTSTGNLWPACKTDHNAKHASGFSIQMLKDGQFALTTPTGFIHEVNASEHPVSQEWPDLPGTTDFQFSITEFRQALSRIRSERTLQPDLVDLWEDGDRAFWELADIEAIEAVYEAA